MKKVIYNQLTDKTPFGAVKDNESTIFRIKLDKNLFQKSIKLVIYNDIDPDNISEFEMNKSCSEGDYSFYEKTVGALTPSIYYYYFIIQFEHDTKYISQVNYEAEIVDYVFPWQMTVYSSEFSTPEWVKGGIMYQIFPDRFNRNTKFKPKNAMNESERKIHDNWNDIPNSPLDDPQYSAKDFFLGNLNGIIDKKEYFSDLNINLIYLNPIFESAENHRYSTSDFFKVDSYLGTNSIFNEMCKKFEKNDIHIILDGVFSHTGSDSIYFNKESRYNVIGAYNSMLSRYYPWYKFIEYPNYYESWWGFTNLPTLRKENEDYMDFIFNDETGVVGYWQNLGIKGWRLDVVDELPDIFIDNLRKSVKSKDNDAFIIGEVWEDASTKFSYGSRRRYLLGEQLDSVMNYPWKNAIISFVKNKDAILFKNKLSEIINNYPTPALDCMMNMLSTHDTERIITNLGIEVTDVKNEDRKNFRLSNEQYNRAKELQLFASFIQFTLPGIPSIYYGDEIGMQGFSDPFNRACFDENNIDEEILNHYIELSKLRNSNIESFKTGFKFGDTGKEYISYYRNDIFCVVNFSEKPIIIEEKNYCIWLFGNKFPYNTEYGIVIPPNSYTAIKVNI